MLNKLTEGDSYKWESKISTELWKVMEEKSDDDLIPVWLWLIGIDSRVITNALINEKGMNPADYEDPARFEREIASEVTRQVEARYGYEEAHYTAATAGTEHWEQDGEFLDRSISLVNWAINAKIDEYRMTRIGIIEREYSALNDKFVADNIGEKPREIIYNSRCTATLIVEATKTEIVAYAKNESVHDISLYVHEPLVPLLNQALTQIGADSTTGTKSGYYNYGLGYKGTGVTIGVIEALETNPATGLFTAGRFDPTAAQLSGINNVRLFYNNDAGPGGGPVQNGGVPVTVTNGTHASFVTSIIVGQPVSVGSAPSVTYEGVVPYAKVYQNTAAFPVDVPRAIRQLVSKGCTVINFSTRGSSSTAYEDLDREVDQEIANLGVTLVVAAGNYGSMNLSNNITSPGKALNAITVGNAYTKSSGTTAITTLPYDINLGSSFNQVAYIPNKPDISAPGTWIRAVQSTAGSGQFYEGTGTSGAAPFVTGVVAQMMERDPLMTKLFPVYVKSRVLQGARADQISTSNSNNPIVDNNYLRDKSGAGMVNAPGAINSMGGTIMQRVYSSTISSSMAFYVAGKNVRVVVVFDKANDSNGISRPISSLSDLDNLDIYLKNPSGTIIASSTSFRNNVEIVEFTVTTTGMYTLEIVPVSRVNPSDEVRVSWSWVTTN